MSNDARKAKKLERATRQLDIVNAQKAKTLERATRQLDIIEQMITTLMAEIDFSVLKTSERLNIALKLMTQHARTLKLYDDISREHGPSSGQQTFVGKLMHFMRNEASDQDIDDLSSFEGDSIKEGV
ncbi:MAG TPA: hypothetical protein VGL94_16365 [Ktedonobacteraceae bacterium]|jgi:hypothetical protein